MAADTELILTAIDGVRTEMQAYHTELKGRVDDQEARLRSAERSILRFKTLGTAITAVASFFGWDTLKHHWLLK